jgi:hypothetical protein
VITFYPESLKLPITGNANYNTNFQIEVSQRDLDNIALNNNKEGIM